MTKLNYYSKIASAPGIVPTTDVYLPPFTGKYNSLSGFVQQTLYEKDKITVAGLLTASSKVVIINNLFHVISIFTLFVKNKYDEEYSTINFNTSFVNKSGNPATNKYSTTSYSGTGIFYNKNYKINLHYNSNTNAFSKISLKEECC